MSEIPLRVTAIINDHLSAQVREPSQTLDELGSDSLDVVEIAILLEDEFGIPEIGDEWTDATTVSEIIADVAALVERKGAN